MPCTLIYAALVVPLTENCPFHGLIENLVAVIVHDSVRRLGLKLLLHLGRYGKDGNPASFCVNISYYNKYKPSISNNILDFITNTAVIK